MFKKILKYLKICFQEIIAYSYGFLIWILYLGSHELEVVDVNGKHIITYPKLY